MDMMYHEGSSDMECLRQDRGVGILVIWFLSLSPSVQEASVFVCEEFSDETEVLLSLLKLQGQSEQWGH